MENGECRTCGDAFSYRKAKPKQFCSKACRYKFKRPTTLVKGCCPVCRKEFMYSACWPIIHCSRSCYEKTQQEGKHTSSACPLCGKEVRYLKKWPRKYCSNVCAGKANVANIAHFAASAYETECEQCGETYTTTPKKTNGRFCSSKCWGAWISVHMTGENATNWQGGYLPYYGPSWSAARRAARERDKVCQKCGKSPADLGYQLHVHHIKRFRDFGLERHEEANALSNLQSLCNPCHGPMHARVPRTPQQQAAGRREHERRRLRKLAGKLGLGDLLAAALRHADPSPSL